MAGSQVAKLLKELIQELLTGEPDDPLEAHFRHIFEGSSADDRLPDLHRPVDWPRHHGDFFQVVAAIRHWRWNRIVFSLIGEGLLIEALEDDLHLFFEELLVGIVVEHRRPERLDLARVIAAPHAENHPPAGEDVRHRKVFGETDRVPHGDDIERTAELQLLRLRGQVRAQQNQVGDAFVAFMLKVVLRHPQGVEVVTIHHLGHIGGHAKGFDHTLIGITPRVRRCTINTNILQFDVPDIEHGEVFDHDLGPPLVKSVLIFYTAIKGQTGLEAFVLPSFPQCDRRQPPKHATAKPYHTCATVPVNSQIRGDTQADARSPFSPPRSSLWWFFCWPAGRGHVSWSLDIRGQPRHIRRGSAMKPSTRFRQLLAQPGLIVAPGAYDGLSAKLIEQAGFDVVYATGGGISRSCGYPDIGLLTMTEVLMHLRCIVEATALPVIGDCDTGYGNALNVMRAVREFERVGVAAFHLEDQITPKRCGHYEGKEVVSCEEMCKKLEAALEARTDPDLVIIARTDARAMHGLDDAIRRGQEYARVGADMIFVEAPRDRDELKRIADAIDRPLVANMVKGGKTPLLSAAELEALGYKLAIFASDVQRAAIYGMREVLKIMKRDGTPEHFAQTIDFPERDVIIGLEQIEALEERFLRL